MRTSGRRSSDTSASASGVASVSAAGVETVGASGARVAAESTANGARLTLETIVALLTTRQDTALLLVFRHGNGRKLRRRMVLSGVVVDLVDWHCGVHDMRLDGLLVHDRLESLVHVLR